LVGYLTILIISPAAVLSINFSSLRYFDYLDENFLEIGGHADTGYCRIQGYLETV